MKVQVEIKSTNCNVQTAKSGKPYAKQSVGVYLPGEDFPSADEMLVNIINGQPQPHPAGMYETNATLQREGINLILRIDYRALKSLATPAKKAA